MNKVPDRERMRREYLWKLTKAIAVGVTGTAIGITFIALTFRLLNRPQHFGRADCLLLIFCYAAMLVGTWLCILSEKRRLAIPYVPPVREQLPTLPAEEVLLRGSQPSPASPEELLRPVVVSRETNAEELLRASVGEP